MSPPPNPANSDSSESDLFEFADDTSDGASPALPEGHWPVLLVDDDPDVHTATVLALRDLVMEGRSLRFLHAYTAAEALDVLRREPDVAVVLLDVVMETGEAGLQLVRRIRDDLGRHALRIILRTGQPGYAPEIDTIRSYDINDYRTKSELTRVRLFTSLTTALRSYRQLMMVEEARRGLEVLVDSSRELNRLRGLGRFAEGVVVQLCGLLQIPPEGLLCAREAGEDEDGPVIIAAAGRYAGLIHRPLSAVEEATLRQSLTHCLDARAHQMDPPAAFYIPASDGRGLAVHVNVRGDLAALDRHLIEVFCANMAVSLDNQHLLARLSDLAYVDPLLRIANRNRFISALDERLASPAPTAVMVLDMDDFAGINQNFGHSFGDGVLQAVARRLAQLAGTGTLLARLGGDTFGLCGTPEQLDGRLLSALAAEPFLVHGERLRLAFTAGVVRVIPGQQDGSEIVKDAYIALRHAKRRERGRTCYFEPSMGVMADERMRLLTSLREAFDEQRLFVAYQPLQSLGDGRTVGAEALLRWRTQDGKFVPPGRFIPLAEQSGLIVAIGEFVLRSACHLLRRIHDAGHPGFRMSINVSQVQFRDPALVDRLQAALRDARVDPACVELEITESMASEDIELLLSVIASIKALGVAIAIDDFGTGYSSLAVLRQLQVDRLKIDRAFVSGMDQGQDAIVRTVIDLARNMGMGVIAEGIETEAEEQALRAMGCPEGQGWLYARAMEADVFEAWLQGQRPPRAVC